MAMCFVLQWLMGLELCSNDRVQSSIPPSLPNYQHIGTTLFYHLRQLAWTMMVACVWKREVDCRVPAKWNWKLRDSGHSPTGQLNHPRPGAEALMYQRDIQNGQIYHTYHNYSLSPGWWYRGVPPCLKVFVKCSFASMMTLSWAARRETRH